MKRWNPWRTVSVVLSRAQETRTGRGDSRRSLAQPRAAWRAALVVGLVFALAGGACAPRSVAEGPSGAEAPRATGPKRMVAAMQGRPVSGYARLNVNSSERGNSEMAEMLHSGLTVTDPSGQVRPKLAEAVPSTDNGQWRVLPDGRMEMTWTIRQGAEWHDGTPLTAEDLVFTYRVVSDRDFPIFRDAAYQLIEGVEAVDARTVLVRWRQPFIRADSMWSESLATPLPKHILETTYQQDKESLVQLPYFTTEWVGLGPYKLKEWDPSGRVLMTANDRYVLGRPKIDEIEVRTIPDVNVIVANLLAGTIDVVIGRTLALDQVITLRERMPDIQVETPLTSFLVVNPQLLYETNPAIIRDVTFRKAMMHALNRQEMVDGINYGMTPVAHGVVFPTLLEGRETEPAAVRYDYDPRRAMQMIEGLGLSKGPDGFYRDPAGQPIKIEIRATNTEINTKTMYAVSDYLQRIGLAMEPVVIPGQLVQDQEWRAKFPGLIVNGGGGRATELEELHSSKVRTAETRYSGGNRAGYRNPELDALIDRYTTTIPIGPRMELARQITRHVTDNLPTMPLFFDTWPGAASPRLINARAASDGAQTWNIHEWDIR